MVRRTKDEALETRNMILDTAERVFSERGVSRTSLADIAKAAGFTRGAIYWHFQDKADLFCKMVARVILPMEDAPCQMDHQETTDPLASIRTMMISILKRTAEDAQARRVFHIVYHKCEYVDEMKPVWKRFNEMQSGCLMRMTQGLQAAIARGQLPQSVDARRAAVGLQALVDGLISSWVKDPDYVPLERETGHIVDLFLGGLRCLPDAKPAPRQRADSPRNKVSRPRKAAGNRDGRRSER